MTREKALEILYEHTASESLRRHALAVETAMRACAQRSGGDVEEWGITGLLHDFDYERHPSIEEHPFVGNTILAERGVSDSIRRAIMSHAEHTGVSRESAMEKCLFAVDELCGFLLAVAYVRPEKRIADVEVRSVRKKMKDKAFARAVSREDMLKGAEELGVDFDEHVAFVLEALKANAESLGV
ncbi:MAG: HDIG domain-containing protein [Bacteroidia bacterium]|nr:HDIG domain-containing protein [Bacteroidia bacterium]